MTVSFQKYEGAGNDFILCDDRKGELRQQCDRVRVAALCDRHFGIGADGLMLLCAALPPYDFEMIYFNSDGRPSTMCGNGGRCIVQFARDLKMIDHTTRFLAVDGPHTARLAEGGTIALSMQDVSEVLADGEDFVLDTGSPHYLRFVEDLSSVDVVAEGRAIRRSPNYAAAGINVNFVQADRDGLQLYTYERGVENETLACGTGVTAAAIGYLHRAASSNDGPFAIAVRTRGGSLSVTGVKQGGRYTQLYLTGPARHVFSGTIDL